MGLQTRVSLPALLLILAAAPTADAAWRTPPMVRVVSPATPIVEWFPYVKREVLATVEPGTTLELLGKEGDWYWVMAPRDGFGTQKAGWVSARNVEVVVETAASLTAAPSQPEETSPTASVPPAPVAAAGGGGAAPAGVTRTLRKQYNFDDVHFALNKFALMPEETRVLDTAVTALKDDPLLRLNVEGYTCNLGTREYNLALGERRANAVKNYLIGKGVPADRLQTVSFGEERPAHDNSSEETRRLNRRVTLVPNNQP